MRNKKFLIVLLLIVLAGAGGVAWFLSLPTLDSTFAEAEKSEKEVRAKAAKAGVDPKDVAPDFKKTIELYQKVAKFGKNDKHAESLARIGKIQNEELHEDEAAIKTYDELVKEYPADEARTGEGILITAGIYRKQGQQPAPGAKPEEITKKFETAIEKLDAYRKAFPKGAKVDKSLLDSGNIKQSDLKIAPAEAIKPFDELVKEYPKSQYAAEAMYHMGELYVQMGDKKKAKDIYFRLSQDFPDTEWGRKGAIALIQLQREEARALADAEEARKALEEAAKKARELEEKYKQEHPEEARQAGDIAGDLERSAASKTSGGSARGRYGSIPVDTSYAASEELKKFAEQKLDAKNYVMNVDFKPEENRVTVSGTLQMTNAGDKKDRQILFMLGNGFEISKLTIDGNDVKYTRVGDTLTITPLDKPIENSQSFLLGFTYTGRFAAPMTESAAEVEKLVDRAIDKPEDLRKAMEEAASAAKAGGLQLNFQIALGKEGFALSGAGWYPITCIGDLFDAKVTYTVPAGTELTATGAEDSSFRTGGKPGEFVYSTKRPVFGIYFAYGAYDVKEKTINGVKYITYMKHANAGKADAYIDTVSRILTFYGDKFVPFPYEKMAIVETPLPPILGGVGPSSMMMLSSRYVLQTSPPEWLLAHELAHQWFGNLVPINIADPGYSQWLSEGFATYCDAMYTEHREGKENFVKQILRYNATYFHTLGVLRVRKAPNVRNCSQSTPLYRPVVYEKGALVLHSLRRVLGDDKFFTVMKRYVETWRDKPSKVSDFEKIASDVYGDKLDWFFEQWLDGSEPAKWNITSVNADPDSEGKSYKLTVKLAQKEEKIEKKVDGKMEVKKYFIQMPVDVAIYRDEKEKKIFPAEIKGENSTFEFTVDFKPVKVTIDEDSWTLQSPAAITTWPKDGKSGLAIGPTTVPSTVPALPPATAPASAPASLPKVETAPAPK